MSTEKGPQTDALTSEQEIVDKLKQYQIALPNGKLVPARGKINNRILSSLVAASKEGRPGVGSEELMTQDISIGIPLEKAKNTLYNSISRLRTITLMGTGCDIITVLDKKGKTNAKGSYCLANTTSKTTENPSMETLILTDDKTIIRLQPRPKKMLQRIIDSGDKGMTTEKLQQFHIDKGVDRKTARTRVRDDLMPIRAALNGTYFTIVNLTSRADSRRGKGGRYVFKETSQEELTLIGGPKQGIETTIFAANGDADSVAQSPSEDPQDEEYDDGDTPQEIEEARQNTLKQQARLQVALNTFNALKNGKLQTLDKDAVAYTQNSLPPGISEQDAKGFIIESINAGLYYWNLNVWDLGPNPSVQEKELIETCRELRVRRLYSSKERAIQEIRTHFSLP